MREFDPAVDSFFADLGGMKVRSLVWIGARNRTTGATETTGFWNGPDVQNFVINTVTRTYFGAGSLLNVSPIRAGVGLEVQMQSLTLSGVTPEVLQLVYGYDPQLAPIEIHQAVFDPETNQLIAEPHRVFKGTIDTMEIPRPIADEPGEISIRAASAVRSMTRPLTIKKSDAAQRIINPADDGRKYASISGAVGVFWGVLNKRAAPPPTVTKADVDLDDPNRIK